MAEYQGLRPVAVWYNNPTPRRARPRPVTPRLLAPYRIMPTPSDPDTQRCESSTLGKGALWRAGVGGWNGAAIPAPPDCLRILALIVPSRMTFLIVIPLRRFELAKRGPNEAGRRS